MGRLLHPTDLFGFPSAKIAFWWKKHVSGGREKRPDCLGGWLSTAMHAVLILGCKPILKIMACELFGQRSALNDLAGRVVSKQDSNSVRRLEIRKDVHGC